MGLRAPDDETRFAASVICRENKAEGFFQTFSPPIVGFPGSPLFRFPIYNPVGADSPFHPSNLGVPYIVELEERIDLLTGDREPAIAFTSRVFRYNGTNWIYQGGTFQSDYTINQRGYSIPDLPSKMVAGGVVTSVGAGSAEYDIDSVGLFKFD